MPNYSGEWSLPTVLGARGQDLWPINGPFTYVDDVFSTYLYEGTGAAQSITNGIDFAGEGGMLWIKDRDATSNNYITDTERSLAYLRTNSSSAEVAHTATYDVTALNSDGFSVGLPNEGVNTNGNSNVSWSFLKKPGFFDVVTYTGNSTSGRGIAHNLGSTPGFVIVKCTSDAEVWRCFHRTFSAGDDVSLNSTAAVAANGHFPTVPDSDNFYVGAGNQVNGTGKTYVAYLFAHDDQRFGDNGDESIIKCGTYGPGTETLDGPEVTLGWEPQWVLVKAYDNTGNWSLFDNMRGVVTNGDDKYLRPNGSNAELTAESIIFTPTGFKITSIFSEVNQSGINYIYIAIRRPMKTPTAATEVFAVASGVSSTPTQVSGFPVDFGIVKRTTGSSGYAFTRLLQKTYLVTETTAAEVGLNDATFDHMNGILTNPSFSANTYYSWMFKRAPGFMDVVATTGASGVLTLNHNLGVPPEFLISKRRNGTSNWYADQVVNYLRLNTDDGNLGTPVFSNFTATTFDADAGTFSSGETYITYLFATLAGISKVGSYTGTAANLDVDCGFTSGARFILIKRTDSTGDWYVYDSVRGIVSGNDPYLLLNSTAAEVTGTDYIDPLSSGFTVTSSAPAGLNASGGSYIFLAIA